jgi:hypothetical protein
MPIQRALLRVPLDWILFEPEINLFLSARILPPAMRHATAINNIATGMEIRQMATIPFAEIVMPKIWTSNSLG